MGSPQTFDIASLAQPIRPEAPTGSKLRPRTDIEKLWWDFSGLLDQERNGEKQRLSGVDDQKASQPRWDLVIDSGSKILVEASKDLWVVAGMVEALTRENGFAGIRDGFSLAAVLVEQFGSTLFPELDPDDIAETGVHTAFLRMESLNNSLQDAIRRIPIIDSPDHKAYSTYDVIRIQEGRGGEDTTGVLDSAARQTPAATWKLTIEDASEAIKEVRRLAAAADEKFVSEEGQSLGPGFSRLIEVIEDCQRRMRSLAGDQALEAPVQGSQGSGDPGAAGPGPRATNPDQIQSREDAYRVLEKVATYFDRTEPHSPTATTLRELVSWSKLSFADLMKRLIEDDSARRELFRRTGVAESSESS